MRKSLKKALSLCLSTAMVISLGTSINADAAAIKTTNKTYGADISAKMTTPYHGYICFQDSIYNYRDGWDDEKTGAIATKAQESNLKDYYQSLDNLNAGTKGASGFDWSKMYFWNAQKGTKTKEATFRDLDNDGNLDKITVPEESGWIMSTADFESPDITYDGTYTVSMKNFNPDTFKYSYGFRMLTVNTTIPYSVQNVKFSNVSLKVDGAEVALTDAVKNGITRNTADAPNAYTLVVANEYGYANYGSKTQAEDTGKKDGAPDPIWEAAKATGKISDVKMPTKSIEITFTVSGLGAKPAGYVPQDDNANAASTAAIAASSAAANVTATPASLAVGKTFKANGLKYKVTKAGETSGSSEVSVVGTTSKKASYSVPKTVSKDDFSYKVTTIGKKAFASNTKLKKITLGKNVTKIEKFAFKGCKKLAAMKVSGKLKTVQKGAFIGCKKTIKVSGASKKANIKALKKSGYKKFK